MNIVFGSLKTGGRASTAEFDYPVMRIEAHRGEGTSRRVMFNKAACTELGLETGENQQILFGFAQPGVGEQPRLFVVNTEEFIREVEHKTYATSKNLSAYSGETSERGKSISNSKLVAELRDFMGQNDEANYVDFRLDLHDASGEANLYEAVLMVDPPADLDLPEENVNETDVDFDEMPVDASPEFVTTNGIDELSKPAMNGGEEDFHAENTAADPAFA